MKLYKIFAISLAALTLSACSDDDDDFNTVADITVSMGQTSLSVSEDFLSGTYYQIPVVLSGETNGPVKVTVDVAPATENPAIEDEHYVITSKTITIPAGETSGHIEFHSAGDDLENPDRSFICTITSAEGASIGTDASCTVTLLDNERLLPEAYAKVLGEWLVTCDAGQYQMTISGYEEGEDGYLTSVLMSGWNGYPQCVATAGFSLDASTGVVSLSLAYGQIIASVRFNNYGQQDVQLIGFDGTYIYPTGSQTIESDENVTTFTFSQGVAGAFNSGGWRAWFTEQDIVMTKM